MANTPLRPLLVSAKVEPEKSLLRRRRVREKTRYTFCQLQLSHLMLQWVTIGACKVYFMPLKVVNHLSLCGVQIITTDIKLWKTGFVLRAEVKIFDWSFLKRQKNEFASNLMSEGLKH